METENCPHGIGDLGACPDCILSSMRSEVEEAEAASLCDTGETWESECLRARAERDAALADVAQWTRQFDATWAELTGERDAALADAARWKARAEGMDRVVEAARDLKRARDERHARSGAMQEAATLARKGGPRGPEAIASVERKHPIVHDVSDSVDRICEALDALSPPPESPRAPPAD